MDVLRILFRDAPIAESDDEDKSGVILDYDKDGTFRIHAAPPDLRSG